MRLQSAGVIRQALANRDLRKVLAAYLLFNVNEWATWIAVLVWAYELGGVQMASVVGLVQLVPSALLASPVATLCGRWPRGRALMVGYAAQSVSSLALGAALLADAPVVLVCSVAALVAVAITFTRPVHNALLPEISQTTGELTAGNAATGSVEAVATFLGPLTSGLVVAAWSVGGVPLTMGALSLLAVLLTVRVGAPQPRRPAGSPRWSPRRSPRRSARRSRRRASGHQAPGPLGLVTADPASRLLCVLIAAEYALVGMMDILLIVLALDVLAMSSAGPGILNSAIGLGGIVGAAFTFVLIGRQRLAPALTLGAVAAGLCFALSALSSTVVPALVLVAATGAGKLFFDVSSRTFVQRVLPDRLLTAVFGIQEAMMMVGLALGTLAAPLLVEGLGARLSFVVAGLFLPVVALLSYPRLRAFDAAAVVPADVLAGLLDVPILAVLAPRVVERLARDAITVTAAAGEIVVAEGESGQRFFVVADGSLEVTMEGHHVRDLGPDAWFGEIALLRDVPRTATVTAITPVTLWAVDRASFLASVAAAPRAVEAADDHARATYE